MYPLYGHFTSLDYQECIRSLRPLSPSFHHALHLHWGTPSSSWHLALCIHPIQGYQRHISQCLCTLFTHLRHWGSMPHAHFISHTPYGSSLQCPCISYTSRGIKGYPMLMFPCFLPHPIGMHFISVPPSMHFTAPQRAPRVHTSSLIGHQRLILCPFYPSHFATLGHQRYTSWCPLCTLHFTTLLGYQRCTPYVRFTFQALLHSLGR